MFTHKLNVRFISIIILFASLASIAHAERANVPRWILRQASVQLEVTVLSVKKTELGQGKSKVLHRARVDRVLLGDTFQVGDELLVVSSVVSVPFGSVGSSGHRSTFEGINGLPKVGDHAKLFAEGKAKLLQPLPPNGWQQIEPDVAFIAVGCDNTSKATMKTLAMSLEHGETLRVKLYDPDVIPPRATPRQNSWMRLGSYSSQAFDFSVLWVTRELVGEEVQNVCSPFFFGESIAAMGETVLMVARSPMLDHKDVRTRRFVNQDESKTSHEVFGVVSVHGNIGGPLRLLAPDEATSTHDTLSGIDVRDTMTTSVPCVVEELAPDCHVLLYGMLIEENAKPRKIPVLWTRELPPAVMSQYKNSNGKLIPEHVLPPQRVMATILSPDDAVDQPIVAALLRNAISWTGNCRPVEP